MLSGVVSCWCYVAVVEWRKEIGVIHLYTTQLCICMHINITLRENRPIPHIDSLGSPINPINNEMFFVGADASKYVYALRI